MVARITLALDAGLLDWPDQGIVAVFNAPADLDTHPLGGERVVCSQSFYPPMAALRSRSIPVTPTPEGDGFSATLVLCHRARAMTLHLLAEALIRTAPGGIVALEGAKTDGIESVVKHFRQSVSGVEVYAKSHGKLAWLQRPDSLPDLSAWHAERMQIDGFWTFPGVFSADGIDPGSALLAAHLPPLSGRVLDLGAGWGFLSRAALAHPKLEHLDLVEADWHAAEAARANITDPRAEVHWADALKWTVPQAQKSGYDAILMNPPFHQGRRSDPSLGQEFIRTAARLLAPRGTLCMVANRNLPYEQALDASFAAVQNVNTSGGFKVIHARKPKPPSKAR